MKKLSLYVFLVLMWCNVSVAEIIVFKKCYLPDVSEKQSWNNAGYKNSVIGKVPRDLFLNNYKNWGMHNKLKEDYFKSQADRNPNLDYITVGDPVHMKRAYGKESLKNLKSIGLKYFPMNEKKMYSIDLEKGIVNSIEILSEEYHKILLDKHGDKKYSKPEKTIIDRYLIDINIGGVVIAYYEWDTKKETKYVFDLEKFTVTDDDYWFEVCTY